MAPMKATRHRLHSAVVALGLLAPIALAALPAPPARLAVSPNHRFLQQADGSPFFWLGDTAWLLFSRLDRNDTRRYLDDRQAKGFTVIQVMVLHTAEARTASGAPALVDNDPGKPRVTPGDAVSSDPAAYDYWDHIDWVAGEAAVRGLYLALVPAWGSVVKSGQLNPANVVAYATFLAKRYRGVPNVIWLVGGDAKGNEEIEVWKALGRTLRAEDPNHLITYHPFGRTQSSTWFHGEPWLDFNMFQSGHRRYDQDTDSPRRFGEDNWRYVLDDYAKTPPKPVLDGEPSYENIPQGLHDGTQPVLDGGRCEALRLLVRVRGRVRPHLRRQRGHAVPHGCRRQGQLLPAELLAGGAPRPRGRSDAPPEGADAVASVLRSGVRRRGGRLRQRREVRAAARHEGPRLPVRLLLHGPPILGPPRRDRRPVAPRVVVQPA